MATMHTEVQHTLVHAVGLGLYSMCRTDQVMYGMVFKLPRCPSDSNRVLTVSDRSTISMHLKSCCMTIEDKLIAVPS